MRNNSKDKYLFTRVLKWASDRGSVGFTMSELQAACANDDEEWTWIQRFMMGEIQGDPPLIAHLGSHHKGDGEHRYFLSGSGASTYIDYLELQEARENSRNAMRWAIASFLLAALVGGAQIRLESRDLFKVPIDEVQTPLNLKG